MHASVFWRFDPRGPAAALALQNLRRHRRNARVSALEVFSDCDGLRVRFVILLEGILAVFYGELVLSFLKANGLTILLVVGGGVIVALLIYLIVNRGKSHRKESNNVD